MYDDPAERLRERGVQVTAQRIAVLGAIAGAPHSTADSIAESARAQIGAISRQAVYDALGVLVDKGIVRRIEPAGLQPGTRIVSATTTIISCAAPAA